MQRNRLTRLPIDKSLIEESCDDDFGHQPTYN